MSTILVLLFIGMAIVIIAVNAYLAYRVSRIASGSRKHGFFSLWVALNLPRWAHPYWRERDEEPGIKAQMERLRLIWVRQALFLAVLVVILAGVPILVPPARP